jgi:hypothetical protein
MGHGQFTLSRRGRRALGEHGSLFANVLVPQCGIFRDEFGEHLHTLVRRKIDHFDSVFLEPIDASAKIHGLAHYYGPDSKLTD